MTTWHGKRTSQDSSAVLMRRVLELPMSPRCRRLLEASLQHGGDLDKGADSIGLSRVGTRKELAALRRLLVFYGLATVPGGEGK